MLRLNGYVRLMLRVCIIMKVLPICRESDIVATYIVVPPFYQAAVLAVQGKLDTEIIATAVTSSWKRHWHIMVT